MTEPVDNVNGRQHHSAGRTDGQTDKLPSDISCCAKRRAVKINAVVTPLELLAAGATSR